MSTTLQHRDPHHLAQMANDIGNFFRAQSRHEDAVAGIVNHITSFWTRGMRDRLIAELSQGDAGLDPLPLEAMRELSKRPDAKPVHPPGGDAG